MQKKARHWEKQVAYLFSCLNVPDCSQQEVGPIEHNGTVGVTAVIEQRHTGGKRKKRVASLSRQSQTSNVTDR